MNGSRGRENGRRPVPELVAERILTGILEGALSAGDCLPSERELAQELRVNRSSLREALKKLEELRLIEIQHGSGTRIRDAQHASLELVWLLSLSGGRPNLPWIADLLELRELLMPALVRTIIESAAQDRLDSAAALLRGTASSQLSDPEFIESLLALPTTLCELGGNRVALLLANSMHRFLNRAGPALMTWLGPRERRGFRPILQRLAVTIEARDADSAERCARDLMRRLSTQTRKHLASTQGASTP
jgi:GntR family transcriptional repressor for pyruvate dehydrogenase complex